MKLRPYMAEVSRRDPWLRMLILYWRRQAGKTSWFGWDCLKTMAKTPGILTTFASVSLNVGAELPMREAKVFREIVREMREEAERIDLALTTNADRLDEDDYLDLLVHSKFEVCLHHSNTIVSRTKIIAANTKTARGYSGPVKVDEFQDIEDFKAFFGAVEPIASSDPTFNIILAGTTPDDDTHFSFELLLPPEGMIFKPNPRGNWYTSQAGIVVHRLDVYDAELAGVHLYDRNTSKPLTPAEHRAQAVDRDAWDRNYALLMRAGGTAAISLLAMQTAQQAGAEVCCAAEDDFPPNWKQYIVPGAPTTIGYDPATTENGQSNPSAVVVAQRIGRRIRFPLVLRYKAADDRKQKAILREVCDLPGGMLPMRLGVDATTERFFAAQVQREFRDICPVELLVMSEIPRELQDAPAGERMIYKSYLGNLLVNIMDDGIGEVPADRWVKDDWRSARRTKGGFDNAVDAAGHHGDTFDAAKIAAYLLTKRGGVAEVTPMRVGMAADEKPQRDFWKPDHSGDDSFTIDERLSI